MIYNKRSLYKTLKNKKILNKGSKRNRSKYDI